MKNYEELRTRSLCNIMMCLQQICDHPYIIKLADEKAPRIGDAVDAPYEPNALIHASAKLELVMRMLPRLKEEGHRVLIFSRFTKMLDLIEEALSSEG